MPWGTWSSPGDVPGSLWVVCQSKPLPRGPLLTHCGLGRPSFEGCGGLGSWWACNACNAFRKKGFCIHLAFTFRCFSVTKTQSIHPTQLDKSDGVRGLLWVIVGHVLLGGPFFLDSYSMSPRSFKETKACSPGPAWSEFMTNSSQILHRSPSSFTYVERAKSSLW